MDPFYGNNARINPESQVTIVHKIITGTGCGSLSFFAPYIEFTTKYHALSTSHNNTDCLQFM